MQLSLLGTFRMSTLISQMEETLKDLRTFERATDEVRIANRPRNREVLRSLQQEIKTELDQLDAVDDRRYEIAKYLAKLYEAAMAAGAVAKVIDVAHDLAKLL